MSRGWVHFLQRWRLPELRLLMLALIVAVTVVTAVGFFTSRVENAMYAQATQLLGGDLVIKSSRPIRDTYRQMAEKFGVKSTQTVAFPSMLSVGDALQLVQLKAVAVGYPLRGELKIADTVGGRETVVTGRLPANGELWAEPRVFDALKVQPNAQVTLGKQVFVLRKVLTQEPDRGTNLFQLAPVVLMNHADLAATGLLTPASRASFNQLFAGESDAIAQLSRAIQPQLQVTERIRTLEEDVRSVYQTLQRAGRFLGLAALLSVVLAGVAVVLTANGLMRRALPAIAVLKAMGMSRRALVGSYVVTLALAASIAASVGVMLGAGLQWVLGVWLERVLQQSLVAPDLMPILHGFLTAFVVVIGFALPALLRAVNASPVAILQGNLRFLPSAMRLSIVGIGFAMAGLLYWQAGDALLASFIFGGVVLGIVVFWGAAHVSLNALKRIGTKRRLAWLAMGGKSKRAVLLVVVFATGLFSLLLLTTIRTDLLERWQETLPTNAPDQFLINIQPNEVDRLTAFLAHQGIDATLYPMIRGRLVEVNGQAVNFEQYADEQAKNLLAREFNLSAFSHLPSSNVVVAGQWQEHAQMGFSIEQGIGKTLRFGLGDRLTFDVAGQRITQPVTSVREVRWDSMQPNFFVIAPPNAMHDLPRTFITSIHVGARTQVVREVVKQFPSVTVIDVGAILTQLRSLIAQASLAVQGIFVFTLIAGVVVLVAALQSQKAERQRELAILKSLGAAKNLLKRRIWQEFLVLGGLAGALAGSFAALAGMVLGYVLFDLPLQFTGLPVVVGMVVGSVLVGIAGYMNLRGLLTVLPLALLKNEV